jgi:serine/threonine-protein kinase
MLLSAGRRLGPYEILAPLGAGGMGEVYRARDTKLNRDIAIKVLPDLFASDPERLARFQREAQVLASLNHPNVAHLYGLEESSGVRALVMELVEGPTLANRIVQGAIPLAEALPMAKQIADALEAAHEQGIIHRDLKPANIKVREDGTVKVLDFGLAKALDPAASSSADVMNSPTLSVRATQAGVILGTAAYMSPEQARGRPADKRADIWAFGVVLFEMLTGTRLFHGETISDTLAAVLRQDIDWTVLPASTAPPIRRVLLRCLDRDPKRRLRDIGEARLEIENTLSGIPDDAGRPVPRSVPLWRRALPWAALASALGVALVLPLWARWRHVPSLVALRLRTELGADASLVTNGGAAAILSPAGAMLAFVAQPSDETPRLYVRRLEQLQAAPLAGTEGAANPFFSPDGQWIAFFAEAKLKKIPVTGGTAITLCDAPNNSGGAWAEDGTIAFLPDASPHVSLLRVPSAGGKPDSLTTLDHGEFTQRWPQMLPGAKAVLFTGHSSTSGFENANLVVQPLPTGSRKVVVRGGYYGRYLPSGHLVYVHDGTLFAAPFDLDRLELAGTPVPVLEGVAANPGVGGAQFAVSGDGTLVYLPGQIISEDSPIYWMDREGKTTPLRATPANWSDLRFAPDGRRLALAIYDGKQTDVWVYEWARDTLSRLTFDPADDRSPVWTPDGRRIVFASTQADKATFNLYWRRADGTGEVQRLTDSKNQQLPTSWHPNGKFLAFIERQPQTSLDLMILPLEADETLGWKPGKPTVFLNSPFSDAGPSFSPDGRWLAYSSDESGRSELYVRPFPGPGGTWQISTGGGFSPTWSRARHELLYGTPEQRIMVAPYTVEGDSFHVEQPRLWSEGRYARRPAGSFDLHSDGDRFAVAKVREKQTTAKQDKVVFIFNFFDELQRIAPAMKR